MEERAEVCDVSLDFLAGGQIRPPPLQLVFGLLPRRHQLVLPALQGQDARRQCLYRQLLGLQGLVEVLQPALHVGKLRANSLQPAVDLTSDVVNLLGHQGYQLSDGLLGEYPFPDLLDYQVLDLPGIQVASSATSRAFPQQSGAHVVGELAALGRLAGVGLPAHPASQ